jgi:hypothetical protein
MSHRDAELRDRIVELARAARPVRLRVRRPRRLLTGLVTLVLGDVEVELATALGAVRVCLGDVVSVRAAEPLRDLGGGA